VAHLAAQVAVTTSLADPAGDFEVNLASTVQLLEALRRSGEPKPLVFASTNKVYGDLENLAIETRGEACAPVDTEIAGRGVDEARPLDFRTPYGCSKGGADQYVLDYARSFGLPATVLRMSCIYGPRQMGSEDQGWVAHFAVKALRGEPVTLYGDGRQVRDLLDVSDAVDAWERALGRADKLQGRAFNLGGGPQNAVSLREVIDHIQLLTGRKVPLRFAEARAGDQRWYVTDPGRARAALGLGVFRPWRDGVAELVDWLARARSPQPAAGVCAAAGIA
jgi:CDP-paratose 2-epimerase